MASRDIKIEWFVVKHPCRESWKAPYKENPNHPQPSSSTSWRVEFLPSIIKLLGVSRWQAFSGFHFLRRHFQDRFDFAELIKKTDHPMPFVLDSGILWKIELGTSGKIKACHSLKQPSQRSSVQNGLGEINIHEYGDDTAVVPSPKKPLEVDVMALSPPFISLFGRWELWLARERDGMKGM